MLPEEISQKGIAEAVGVNRGHASVALISLKGKGLVEEQVSRVRGSPRRKKVYFLTDEGIEEGIMVTRLKSSPDGDLRPVEGQEPALPASEVPLPDPDHHPARNAPPGSEPVHSPHNRQTPDVSPSPENEQSQDSKPDIKVRTLLVPEFTGSDHRSALQNSAVPESQQPPSIPPDPPDHIGSEAVSLSDPPSLSGVCPEASGSDDESPSSGSHNVPHDPTPSHHPPPPPPGSDGTPPVDPDRTTSFPPVPSCTTCEPEPTPGCGDRAFPLFAGLTLMVLGSIFLTVAVNTESFRAFVVSYLFLIPGFFLMNAPVLMGGSSMGEADRKLYSCDLTMSLLSFMILSTTFRILVDREIAMGEIGQMVLVIFPLMVILSLGVVARPPGDIMVAGLAGTLLLFHGVSRLLLGFLPGHLEYPMLWILGGVMIHARGLFLSLPPHRRYLILPGHPRRAGSEYGTPDHVAVPDGRSPEADTRAPGGGRERGQAMSGRMPHPTGEEGNFNTLMISTAWGLGVSIMVTLISLRSDLPEKGASAALPLLWFILGLLLLLFGIIPGTRDRVSAVVLSSVTLLAGVLFLYAAVAFIMLEMYIEAAVEVGVGVLLLRFGIGFLSYLPWHRLYTSFR